MPIKPENRHLYPPAAQWRKIRLAILERAANCCEGSPAYPACMAENGKPHPVTESKVVLTIAHLDHDPANNDHSNLKALCQRCHLTYDAQHHAQNAAQTRHKRRADAGQPALLEATA